LFWFHDQEWSAKTPNPESCYRLCVQIMTYWPL
jgi:hypothetical protein